MNKNNKLKLILLNIIVEFLNILNNKKIKIKDKRVNENRIKNIYQVYKLKSAVCS